MNIRELRLGHLRTDRRVSQGNTSFRVSSTHPREEKLNPKILRLVGSYGHDTTRRQETTPGYGMTPLSTVWSTKTLFPYHLTLGNGNPHT